MAKILLKEGHKLFQAATGKEAVEVFERVGPDLVFMDITMPAMDGVTAVEEIKKLNRLARIVMLSAMGQKEVVLKAIEKGAMYFLVKPCDPDRLLQTIDKFLPKQIS